MLAKQAAAQADLAVLVFSEDTASLTDDNFNLFFQEQQWYDLLQKRNTPVIFVLNKADLLRPSDCLADKIMEKFNKTPLQISAIEKKGMDSLTNALIAAATDLHQEATRLITGHLVTAEDLVLLVMPQDIQAPKGRLILPQVQTLRELLYKKCLTM